MSSYDALASSYDGLMADGSYRKRAGWLERLFRKSRIPVHSVLDLACGTGTIACLLPATSFNLGSVFAPARDMVNAGVAVAMASDFNPGSCPCLNLQFVINLGCLKYKLTPEEVLTAVTLNAAAAIKLADKVGSVEPGKQGDLVIWDAPDLDYICYRVGSNLAKTVIKKGAVV